MDSEQPGIAVCVGAYNEPDLLERALESIVGQSYRPLTVIISDDAGQAPLGHVADSFRKRFPDIGWQYSRQMQNLGVARNKVWLFGQVDQEFCCYLEHDDAWVSEDFLSQCASLMSVRQDLNICIGNAIFESTGRLMYQNSDPGLQLEEGWQLVEGYLVAASMLEPVSTRSLLLQYLGGGRYAPFGASWSSIMFRTSAVRKSGGLLEETLIPVAQERELSVYSNEEGFSFLHKLLAMGPAALSFTAVSLRGMPETSFSNSPTHPGREAKNNVEFFALLANAQQVGDLDPRVAKLLVSRAKSIGLGKINKAVARFVGDGLGAVGFVVVARLRGEYHKILRLSLVKLVRLLMGIKGRFRQKFGT